MGCSRNSPKREVYSNTILPQETRKTPNTLTKKLEKEDQKPPKLVEGKKSQRSKQKEMKEKRKKNNNKDY